jgi:hypothetical protein
LSSLLTSHSVEIGKEEKGMNSELPFPAKQQYIPSIGITRATRKHSWGRLLVATALTPNQPCGQAHRIGYIGQRDDDPTLYRLKIKLGNGLPTVTLPSLYIIEDGTFVDYEQWHQNTEQ